MAELLALGTALASSLGGTAAAGTAVAAGASLGGGLASAATAAASTSSALAILQGVGSAVSALGAIGGGLAAMSASNAEADQTELQAGQEQLQATQRQTDMKRNLLRVMGENDVAFAAAGIDVGQGIAGDARANATQRATSEINIDRDSDEYRRALLKSRAGGLRRRGGQQFGAGLLNAASIGIDFGIDQQQRG